MGPNAIWVAAVVILSLVAPVPGPDAGTMERLRRDGRIGDIDAAYRAVKSRCFLDLKGAFKPIGAPPSRFYSANLPRPLTFPFCNPAGIKSSATDIAGMG